MRYNNNWISPADYSEGYPCARVSVIFIFFASFYEIAKNTGTISDMQFFVSPYLLRGGLISDSDLHVKSAL